MTGRVRRSDDTGATLLLVLLLVTVIALVMGTILSLTDTNLKTTRALNDQASSSYSVDGAAQVTINKLRTGTFPTNCATTTTSQYAPGIPASPTQSAASVAVRCTPDPSNTGVAGGGANSSPGSAILTLSNGAGGERGIYVNSSASASVKVRGGIFSNTTIFLEGNKSDLETTNTTNSYVYAMGNCSSSGTSKIISTPAKVCNYSTNPLSALRI